MGSYVRRRAVSGVLSLALSLVCNCLVAGTNDGRVIIIPPTAEDSPTRISTRCVHGNLSSYVDLAAFREVNLGGLRI